MRATHKDYIPLCRCQGTFEHGQVVVVEEVVLEVSMVDDVPRLPMLRKPHMKSWAQRDTKY
jgi:hypothetical protein